MFSTDKTEQLKAFYYFLLPTLSEESWEICRKVVKVASYKKGAMIQRAGTVENNVYFVNSGLVRMFYDAHGKEKIVCFFNENNYMSDYQSFITRKPGSINIQALENTEAVVTSYSDLQMLYNVVPEANYLGRLMAEQLFIKMNEHQASDANDTIEKKYIQLVHEMPWLTQKVPQYMIASYLGITPEALSRVKARMNKPNRVAALVG